MSEITTEQLEKAFRKLRAQRDRLLAETDWWAVQDRTMSQEEIDYRQALRDLPDQDGFPLTLTMPKKPS